MKIMIAALVWGSISAVSLPLGAVIGLWSNPARKLTSALMAFGGGALLFALTIELFAHSLDNSNDVDDIRIILATITGAVLGGLLFEGLNQVLNNRGAFLRKPSLIKKHILKVKRIRAKNMIRALSKVRILQLLPAKEVVQLIPHVKISRFPAGATIFSQGDIASELYFIVKGVVQVIRVSDSDTKIIAELRDGDIFGEIALISDMPRTATIRALTDITVCTIHKIEFEHLIKQSPAIREASSRLVKERLQDIQIKDKSLVHEAKEWEESALGNLDRLSMSFTEKELNHEIKEYAGGSAALSIWLGIALDGIPESLIIGILVVIAATSGTSISLAFIAGVFLANLPEAMSSAVTMKRQGTGFGRIFWMWMSLCVMTGLGALVGALIFPAHPEGTMRYAISAIEGIAGGAMLTMIAETMLPEAFEQGGGTIVGLSTLVGFLAALSVKIVSF
ncbi:MAG: cyclic nucleotide-binding domain-containing protein [Deltaproteobacteria bacterium]|nr:cyclic nucleotide-binding domain-containing protein [Deltaproteobacteria bacterium]